MIGLVLLAGAVAVVLTQVRFGGGPLSDPAFGGITERTMKVGDVRGLTEIHLEVPGDRDVSIERIEPIGATPQTEVSFFAVQPGSSTSYEGFWPPPDLPESELRPVAGHVVPAGTRGPDGYHQVVARIRAAGPGCIGFDGVRIDYKSGFLRYRRDAIPLHFHARTQGAPRCDWSR